MTELLQYPAVRLALAGAFSGFLGAARADYQAFKSQNTPQKFLSYDWGVAVYRWAHGAVVGAVGVFFGATIVEAVL